MLLFNLAAAAYAFQLAVLLKLLKLVERAVARAGRVFRNGCAASLHAFVGTGQELPYTAGCLTRMMAVERCTADATSRVWRFLFYGFLGQSWG